GPTVTVTSNPWPRLTGAGAAIFGVCLPSYDRWTSGYSGVNLSACIWAPTRAVPAARAMAAMAVTTPDTRPYLIACFPPSSVLGQKLADQREQVPRAVRLGQVGRGAGVHGPRIVAAQRQRRYD